MIERVLRWTAIAIAALAFIDPPVTLSGRTRPRISVAVEDGPSMALPARDGAATRREAAANVRTALHRRLGRDFEITDLPDSTAAAAVVIGDGYPQMPLAERVRTSTVTVSAPLVPNVRIAQVEAPPTTPAQTAVHLAVTLEAAGLRNQTTSIVVRARNAEVARAEHRWTSDPESWRADLDVVPIGVPPFRFEIEAEPAVAERATTDNHAAVDVDLAPRLRVLVFEARPSWATAFARRALEADARFEVSGTSDAAPRGAVRTGDAPMLDPSRLDAVDVVVLGGLDRLQSSTVALVDRFMTERGGAVALLPDAPVPDSIARALLGGTRLHQTLLEHPTALVMTGATVPRLDASEILDATELPAGASILATLSSSGRPVVWSSERRSGRLLVSGAMDAWRFRAATSAGFDRFWPSLVSALALEAEPAVRVELAPRRAAPGDRVRVVARVRTLERDRLRERLAVSARVGRATPIRLWPDAEAGVFTGSLLVDSTINESTIVTATTSDGVASGSARLTIDATPREAPGLALATLAASHGGVDVGPDNLAELERHLRAAVDAPSARAVRHPMRSPWWLAPFGAALSVEWWRRRRRGAR